MLPQPGRRRYSEPARRRPEPIFENQDDPVNYPRPLGGREWPLSPVNRTHSIHATNSLRSLGLGLPPRVSSMDVFGGTTPFVAVTDVASNHSTAEEGTPTGQVVEKRRFSWDFAAIVIAVISALALALGAGLGVGLPKGHDDGGIEPPGSGAMIFSGAVGIDLELVLNDKSKITGYFQRFDGIIELIEYFNNSWINGPNEQDLNTTSGIFNGESLGARAGTPLMALSYINPADELIWHVIYVTADNFLSDWVNSNTTGKWSEGTLRNQDFAVSTSNHTGLTACVNEQWYGAPLNDSGLGIRLFYGNQDDTITEVGWNLGGTDWFEISKFEEGNGAGGFECTVRGLSITYLWMENKSGELQQMWYDFNLTAGTETHAVGSWQKGLVWPNILHNSAISAINDFTSVPHSKHVLFQAPDLSIIELISNGTAENDGWGSSFIVGYAEKALNGTRIGSVILNTGIDGAQELHVLVQTTANNMIDFIRGLTNFNWARKEVPVGI